MRRINLFPLALFVAFSLTGCLTAAPIPPGPAGPSTSELAELLDLVNEARASGYVCGSDSFDPAGPLEWDEQLGLAAQHHSEDMNAAGVMSHTTPVGAIHYAPGSSPWDRVGQEGYLFLTAGENIAAGYHTPASVIGGWLASTGHCKNIMNATFTEIGLGLGGAYWTQVFAKPRE